ALPCLQAAAGEGRVAGVEHLEAEPERGYVAPGEVGADRCARRARTEDRPPADVAVERIFPAEAVVGLWQPPDVVVTGGGAIALADPHLVVERAGFRVEH